MKTFRGFKNTYTINGNEGDGYFKNLPEHDLGGLSNFFFRVAAKRHIRVCLDIGSNIGLSNLIVSEIAPTAYVYAFEPSVTTYQFLAENIQRANANGQVLTHCCAVGRQSGTARFADNQSASAGNHLTVDGEGAEVAITTVDIVAASLPTVDFIKIDVEGFEIDVLEGAAETIFKHRPIIFLEYNHFAIVNNRRSEPAQFLQRAFELLGPLGIVEPLTGEVTRLPTNAHDALAQLIANSKTEFDVFDLVNQAS